jgi:predicted TIM-barrel fold metal-dependent hydrolase
VSGSLRERALRGEPLAGTLVIDSHAHMGPWFNFHIPSCDADGMVRTMDRLGVDCCVASGHAAIGPDFRLGNEVVAQAAAAHPGRIYGYIGVNPNYSADEMREELRRCRELAGFVGIKLHPDVHKTPADDERYALAWEFAAEHGLPVLSHAGAGSAFNAPSHFSARAEQHPNVAIILAHSASSQDSLDAAIELAAKRENVYLDICGSPLLLGVLEEAVGRIGSRRLLFGTDLPFIDPRPGLGRLAFARIGEEEKRDILGRNAARVFSISRPP